MKRCLFIRLLGGAATWPLAVRAQQPKIPVIGLVSRRRGNSATNQGVRLPCLQEKAFMPRLD